MFLPKHCAIEHRAIYPPKSSSYQKIILHLFDFALIMIVENRVFGNPRQKGSIQCAKKVFCHKCWYLF